jgi:hypothetical protein
MYPQPQSPPLPTLLTDEEKVKVRHHLGFLNVQEAYTFVLGTPAGVETQFIVEGAMNRLLPAALPLVRNLLCKCDETECQRFESQPNLAAAKVGNIELRGKDEQDALVRNYDYWRQALANAFGVYTNPFDKRVDQQNAGSPINVRVEG